MESLMERIDRLQKEKDVIILAHYYVEAEVQAVANEVGDSYYLSKIAVDAAQKNILFCGVSFMGESAKILSPNKRVFMADAEADCPMAHMADPKQVQKIKEETEDVCVVCYINSTAELKAVSDVCVTSSNALKIVKELPQKNIYFIPDNNLGRYIASQVQDKNFIFNDGYCHVHQNITKEDVLRAKKEHKNALVLVHPECTEEVTALGDYIGSTLGIIDFATKSDAMEFIICTELGILYELEQKNPGKRFYAAGKNQICPDMKRITLSKIAQVLETFENEVLISDERREKALGALSQMHMLAEKKG